MQWAVPFNKGTPNVMLKTEDIEVRTYISHLHHTFMKLQIIHFQIAFILYTNPCVVDAVTDTTMIVAAGIISPRSTFVTSSSFCNSYEDESRQSVIKHEHTGLEVVHLFTCKICFDSSFTWSLVKMHRLSMLNYKSRVLACATCAMQLVTTGVIAQKAS